MASSLTPAQTLQLLVSSVAKIAVKSGSTSKETIEDAKTVRRRLASLGSFMNGLELDAREAASRMTMEEAINWMKPLRAFRFARQAAARADTRSTEEAMMEAVKDIYAWVAALGDDVQDRGHVSELSGQTSLAMLRATAALRNRARMGSWEEALRDWRVSDYLYSVGTVGVAVQLFRSEAAAINPWLIVVTRVSTRRVDTAGMLCLLHAGAKYDGAEEGYSMQDAIAVADPECDGPEVFMRTAIHAAQLSVAFTRNPDVIVPGQHVALLAVTFVKAVEQLFERGRVLSRAALVGSDSTGSAAANSMDDSAVRRQRRRALVGVTLDLAFTLRRLFGHQSDDWTSWLDCLRAEIPGRFLTEAPVSDGTFSSQGLPSVAKALTAFACMAVFPGPNRTSASDSAAAWRHFMSSRETVDAARRGVMARALFAEAVSRGCRILIRSDPRLYTPGGSSRTPADVAQEAIRRALGIRPIYSENGAPVDFAADSSYNLATGRRQSGRFFADQRWRTNASPQAVAACLAWARFFAERSIGGGGGSPVHLEDVLRDSDRRAELEQDLVDFAERDGGMPEFLVRYGTAPDTTAPDATAASEALQLHKDRLQTALYVQGLRYHDSAARRHGVASLADPDAVLRAIAAEERQRLLADELARVARETKGRTAGERKAARLAVQRMAQAKFLAAHGAGCYPRLFNAGEVAELNQRLGPGEASLELMPGSGLLRHRCCFTGCEEYLVDQATRRDRELGRRNGLFRHLAGYLRPERARAYKPGMHVRLVGLLARNPGASVADMERAARVALAAERKRTAGLVVEDDDEDAADERDLMGLVSDVWRQRAALKG
ncbi:hypothetical protein HK405_003832 [Cladochytrium tenue]|nr:hypothetical protein HK405_003832 [Cladochytrium tenue]